MTAQATTGPDGRVVAGALAGLILALLIWAQFRSFDLLDAATHFLTYQYPSDNPDTHTRYHLLARPIWLICGGNIVAFRLVCLGLLSSAALIFWRAWASEVSTGPVRPWAAFALWISTMGGIAWLPVLLGYNSLSTLFALCGYAALVPLLGIGGLTSPSRRRRVGWFATFLLAVAGAALVKPPAALAMIAWSGLLALTLVPWPRSVRLGVAILALAGAAFGVWYFSRLHAAPASAAESRIEFGGVRLNLSWVLATLERYLRELGPFFRNFAGDIPYVTAPSLLLAATVAIRLRGRDVTRPWMTACTASLVLAWLAAAVARRLWDGSFATAVSGEMPRYYLLLWVALLPAWLVAVSGGLSARREVPIVTAFFFLPWTCGFGSTNTLYFSALHWTVFWTAGLLVVSRAVAAALVAPSLHRTIVVLTILTGCLHIYSGHILRPYMHQAPLWQQTVPMAVGNPATTLRLDPATARFLSEVRGLLDRHGYAAGDDVFGFFNLPGVVFAVGAKQPGAPWYFGTWYGGSDIDGAKLRRVDAARKARAWIITQADVTSFRDRFRDVGIDFPDAYSKIGQTINPTTGLEIAIWKPKARF